MSIGLDTPLLPAEQLLLQTLATGTAVDLRTTTGDATKPVPVRAGLIRAIIRNLYIPATEIDPHGIQITGALIDERLDLDDATFTRPLTFTHCTLNAGLTAERATLHTLTLDTCTITAPTDNLPAVMLDDAHINQGLNLANSHITGKDEIGAVRLLGASIGGQLNCEGGTFTNTTGPALAADGLSTTDTVFLAGEFAGEDAHGVVKLSGARIGGSLVCTQPGSVTSRSTGALDLTGVHIEQNWFLDLGFRAAGTPAGWLNIDGLTYQGLPQGTDAVEESAKEWAAILSHQTVKYAAQPWQHLAAAHRNAGHVEDATTLLITQQDDRHKRILKKTGNRYRVWLHGASRIFTRYGYKASRALIWLLCWAIIGTFFALGIGQISINTVPEPGKPAVSTPIMTHKPDTATAPTPSTTSCSTIEQIGLGLEWSIPILTTKASDTCQLNTTHPTGQWLTALTWVLRLIGWALATIAIAGYTGIIRHI